MASPEDRGSRRDRRTATSTATAIAARGVLLLGSFISLPLTIGYLGVERYGIFVALTSLTAMFAFADLGLGNGLLNVVSDANGRDDRETARRAVSSAFFMLVAVAVGLGLILLIGFSVVPWSNLLGGESTNDAEIAATAAVLLGLFLVALPLGVVERVRMAYQEGFVNSIAAMIGALLGLAGLAVAILFRADLPLLVLAVSAGPVATLAFNGYRLLARDRPWLRPRLSLADRETALRLARIGFLFLVLQVAVAVAYQSDVLIAAAILGPDAAATYAVTLKVFLLVPTLISLFLVALWPAYTEALARHDIDWVRRALRRSVLIAAVTSGAASLVLIFAGGWVIQTLSGGQVNPPFPLLVGAALWATVSASFNAVAMLLNAASVVFFQVVVASLMAVGSIGLSILFANAFGVSGIVWGTLLAYTFLSAVPVLLFLPRILRQIEGRSNHVLTGVGSG